MKIGFDAKRAFCNFRGLGNYSRSLISSLVKFYPENQYHLFTPKIKDEFKSFLDTNKNVHRHQPNSFISKRIHPYWRSFQVADEVEANDLDIYHGLSHEIPNGIQNKKCKSVVSVHDLMYIHFPQFFPWIDRYTYDKKIKFACENSDSIVAICQQTKNDLINYYDVAEEKVEVIYQSIGDHYFNRPSSNRDSVPLPEELVRRGYILSVGAFVPNKNFESLIKAYAQIHDQISEYLVIAGVASDEAVKKYMDLARELNIDDKVYLTQQVTTDKLPLLYEFATVFVLASFHEGFGIPIIEAMASGCPIAATGGGAHQEAAGGHGLFFDPNSIEEIAQKTLQLVENKRISSELIELGRTHSQSFTSQKVSQKLFEHYEKVSATYTN